MTRPVKVTVKADPRPHDPDITRRLVRATEILLHYIRQIDSREKAA